LRYTDLFAATGRSDRLTVYVVLGIAELNHIRIDKLIAANAALAPYLARQPVPGEEELEAPGIRFGHAAIGTVPVQPGLS